MIIHLPARKFIAITGVDTLEFLQNIITNDVYGGDITASYLLTPQGKYIADFMVVKWQNGVIIDLYAGHLPAVAQCFKTMKLKARVEFAMNNNLQVYSDLTGNETGNETGMADPRHPNMGVRIYSETPLNAATDTHVYITRRIENLVAEGPDDYTADSLVMNYPINNMVSFAKGCFVGQEVTARMKYRHLAKYGLTKIEKPHNYMGPWQSGQNMIDGAGNMLGRLCSTTPQMALLYQRLVQHDD